MTLKTAPNALLLMLSNLRRSVSCLACLWGLETGKGQLGLTISMANRVTATALLVILFAFGVCFAVDYSGNGADYVGNLGRLSNEAVSLYFLLAATAFLSFIVVLIKPTVGIILAMLLFPFVTQNESMTLPKLLASIVLFGFFVAWVAGKIALSKGSAVEKDYLGCERAFIAFFIYLLFNSVYAVFTGIPPLDIMRDLIPIFSLIIFLIFKRFVKTEKSFKLLEKFQFVLMVIFTLEFTLIVAVHFYWVHNFLPVQMSALQMLGLFFASAIGLIYFNGSKLILIITMLISIFFLVATDNRTQFISAIGCLALIMAITKVTKTKMVFFFASIVLLFAVFLLVEKISPGVIEKKTAKLNEVRDAQSDLSLVDRFGEAKQCYAIFVKNPIIGVGAGYTYHLFRQSLAGYFLKNYWITNFTHSDIMNLLAKIGLTGTLLFFWFYYKISKLAWLIWRKAADPNARAKGLICFAILINAIIIGQSTPVLQTRIDAFFLALTIGYTYCLYHFYVAVPEKNKTEAKAEEAALVSSWSPDFTPNLTPAYGHPSPARRGEMRW